MFRRVRVVGGRLQNRYCANFGEITEIRIVPVLGRHTGVVAEGGAADGREEAAGIGAGGGAAELGLGRKRCIWGK